MGFLVEKYLSKRTITSPFNALITNLSDAFVEQNRLDSLKSLFNFRYCPSVTSFTFFRT